MKAVGARGVRIDVGTAEGGRLCELALDDRVEELALDPRVAVRAEVQVELGRMEGEDLDVLERAHSGGARAIEQLCLTRRGDEA